MNEKLQTKLSSLLEWVESATTTGVNFVAEQTPLYITELLTYNFWISLIWFSIFIILLLCSVGALIYTVKYFNKHNFWHEEISPFIMFYIFPILICVWGAVEHTDWIKIKLAPRVYIVDYLRTELKK
jgi:Zn-dependent protease with chaperone function